MSSSNQHERLFKLWISLWNLVLENKRHLETVATLLQRIVFEQRGYPKFKNLPEICKIGETDHLIMTMLATADISRPNEITRQLMSAFPQCFAEEEVAGPYPLSVIMDKAFEEGQSLNAGSDLPYSCGVIPDHIPMLGFDKRGNMGGPSLPSSISPDLSQGTIVTWEDRKFIVMENNYEQIWLAPAECILIDEEIKNDKKGPPYKVILGFLDSLCYTLRDPDFSELEAGFSKERINILLSVLANMVLPQAKLPEIVLVLQKIKEETPSEEIGKNITKTVKLMKS